MAIVRPRSMLGVLAQRLPAAHAWYQQLRILASIARHRFLVNPVHDCDQSHLRQDWDFTSPAEQLRHERVIEAIAAVHGPRQWGDVLELGCSEGAFTAAIASRSVRVTATDLSPVACERAANRCAGIANVSIRRADLRSAWPTGSQDLIIAMCVWEYLQGREQHEEAARKLLAALRPGGLLVINSTRLPAPYEDCWWARRLVVGGAQIVRFLSAREGLRLMRDETFPDYALAVFAKA